MSVEQLLTPRYKVIAKYPGSRWEVGHVVHLLNNKGSIIYRWSDNNGDWVYEYWFMEYPAIFKKLQWWEERQEGEMPQYVKILNQQDKEEVYKVNKWNNSNGMPYVDGFGVFIIKDMEPASESDYLTYINQSK